MLEEIKEKQNFLRKEILDKDLDGEEFYAYLIGYDEEKGDNLELWNMEDLKKIVKSFQKNKSEEKKSERDIKEIDISKNIKNKKLKIEDEKVQSPRDSFFEVNEKEKNEITKINNLNILEEIKQNEIEENNNNNKEETKTI